jgi:hypothetical protein
MLTKLMALSITPPFSSNIVSRGPRLFQTMTGGRGLETGGSHRQSPVPGFRSPVFGPRSIMWSKER